MSWKTVANGEIFRRASETGIPFIQERIAGVKTAFWSVFLNASSRNASSVYGLSPRTAASRNSFGCRECRSRDKTGAGETIKKRSPLQKLRKVCLPFFAALSGIPGTGFRYAALMLRLRCLRGLWIAPAGSYSSTRTSFPGLRIPSGSNAALMPLWISSSVALFESRSASSLMWPTPCSPLPTPPSFTASAISSA